MEVCEGLMLIYKVIVLFYWGFNFEKDIWNLIFEIVLFLLYIFGINCFVLIS